MCSVNHSATFKELFSTVENDYSKLYAVMPDDSIGTRIYKLRKLHDMSFKEFSQKVSVGVSTVHKWENGVRIPSEESLDKVVRSFHLDEKYFDIKKD